MRALTVAVVFSLTGLLSLAAIAQDKTPPAQEFVRQASIVNRFEIESSELALKKAKTEEVKSFAQQMVNDHTKTGEKLKQVLSFSRSDIKPEQTLDTRHKMLMDKLQSASGESFDRQYIALQTDAHEEAVSLFSDYAQNGDNKPLKDFAAETLPALEQHLKHIRQM